MKSNLRIDTTWDGVFHPVLIVSDELDDVDLTVTLLRDEERGLDRGRFKNFKSEIETDNIVYFGQFTSIDHYTHSNAALDWISENINKHWSLHVDLEFIIDASRPKILAKFYFYFESEIDAMHFALRWK